ncbi:MAG: sigma-70 family RNA polymerase sigma factor [Phycisphaerae bacterium]
MRASKRSTDEPEAVRDSGGGSVIAFADETLVQHSREGDMQAFGALVAKYQDRIFNLVYRMIGNRAEAEEIAQDAFLKALERLDQFRGNSKFYTWLFRIAANLAISHRRRAGRIRFHSMTGPEEFENDRVDVLTAKLSERRTTRPDAAAMAGETSLRIARALEELDDDFRLVVVLRDVEEMDYAQIAECLGLPAGTVKSRLHRARCLLREKLKDLVS